MMKKCKQFTKLNSLQEVIDYSSKADGCKIDEIPGFNLVQYRKLMPAIDSPVGIPTKSETIGLGRGYRDPTKFRYSEIQKPFIDVCTPVSFTRSMFVLYFPIIKADFWYCSTHFSG